MKLGMAGGLVCLLLLSMMAGSVMAQDEGIITQRPRYGHGPGLPLPEMKLVIRDEAMLFAVGEPHRGLIDFSKEMALFVSSDWKGKQQMIIRRVTLSGEKMSVTLEEGQADQRRSIVVVPRSDAEVEGFSTSIPVAAGLVVESAPIQVDGEVNARAFEAKAKELGYTVSRHDPAGRAGPVNALLFNAGPDSEPRAIVFNISGVRLGRNYGAIGTLIGLPARGQNEQQAYAVDAKRVQAALEAAFKIDPEVAMKAAEKFTGPASRMIMLNEFGRQDIVPDQFEKFIGSQEEIVYRHRVGQMGDYLTQQGPKGAIIWRKPYVQATRKTDDQGTIVLVLSELGTFQARFEGLKSTDLVALRKTVADFADATGVKLQEKALSEAVFGFYFSEAAAQRETVTVETGE